MSESEVYALVEDAIENHELNCKCRICLAFVNARNGSEGHAAACNAVHLLVEEKSRQS